jgi:hypothetical protein
MLKTTSFQYGYMAILFLWTPISFLLSMMLYPTLWSDVHVCTILNMVYTSIMIISILGCHVLLKDEPIYLNKILHLLSVLVGFVMVIFLFQFVFVTFPNAARLIGIPILFTIVLIMDSSSTKISFTAFFPLLIQVLFMGGYQAYVKRWLFDRNQRSEGQKKRL